jgi:hypothetical protein
MIDRQSMFVDTAWPHAPIGIVHMSADTKQGKWTARLVDGGSISVELRRSASRGSRAIPELIDVERQRQ